MKSQRMWLAAAAACTVGACTEPEAPVGGLVLEKVAGDNQSFIQGRTLPDTIIVKVTGTGLTGLFVSFTVTEGAGRVTEDVVTPDANGLARTVWTLGPGTGRNTLVAFSPGHVLSFTAAATPPSGAYADSMVVQALPPAQWPVNDTVRASVLVTDIGAVPVPGASVVFAVIGGGGNIEGAAEDTVTTNAAGVAQSRPWRLGKRVGSNTLSAATAVLSQKGRAPVVFTVGSTPLAAHRLGIRSIVAGAVQSGIKLTPLPILEVRDTFDNLVSDNGAVVTATLATALPGTRLVGTPTATAVSGVAVFDDLVVFGPPGSVKIRFATPGYDSTESSSIGVVVGPPSIHTSTVAVLPTTVMVGDTAVVTLTIRDDYGTPVSGAIPALATRNPADVVSVPGPSDAQGRTVAFVVPRPIDPAYRTYANDLIYGGLGNLPFPEPAALEVRSPGGSLSFVVQPSPLLFTGSVITPALEVIALDSTGVPMTGFAGPVTIGPYTVNAVNGVAVFPSVSFAPSSSAGGRTWVGVASPGLYGAGSAIFELFNVGDVMVTVLAGGGGNGTVDWGILFGTCVMVGQQRYSDCRHAFTSFFTTYTLTATPAPGSVFMGWSGDCSGTGACLLDPGKSGTSRTVTATFQ